MFEIRLGYLTDGTRAAFPQLLTRIRDVYPGFSCTPLLMAPRAESYLGQAGV